MIRLKQALAVAMLVAAVAVFAVPASFADGTNCCPPKSGKISGRSVVSGVLSFLIWPGIGQAVNSQPGKKVVTHALLGLIPPYRFFSGYDGLVDRDGGYADGRI